MNVKMTEEQLKTTVGKLMNDRECGEVFRVKRVFCRRRMEAGYS